MRLTLKSLYQKLPLKKQIFILIKAFGTPSFYKRLHFGGTFRVDVGPRHSFLLRNHNRYGLETEFFWQGIDYAWEPASLAAWIKLCEGAEVILDVGASEGVYSLVAKCLRPSASVVAFEPLPAAFAVLEGNVQLNHYDITCLQLAVSDLNGDAQFFSKGEGFTTEGSLLNAATGGVTQRVAVKRLDNVIRELGLRRLDLMKLDVEGVEPQALRGMGEYLRLFKPTLLVEVLNDEVGKEVEGLVRDLGYVYFDINDDPRIGPMMMRRVSSIRKSICLNYLLIMPEVASRVGLTP